MEQDTSPCKIDPKWTLGQTVNKPRAVVTKKKSSKDSNEPQQTKLPAKVSKRKRKDLDLPESTSPAEWTDILPITPFCMYLSLLY